MSRGSFATRVHSLASSFFNRDESFNYARDEGSRSRLRSIVKMLSIVLMPTVALVAVISVNIKDAVRVTWEVNLAMSTLEEGLTLARLVEALQVERGLSSTAINRINAGQTDAELFAHLQKAQSEVDDLIQASADTWIAVAVSDDAVAENALEFARYLTAHRTERLLFAERVTFHQNIRFYSGITTGLIDVIRHHVVLPPVRRVWSHFVALVAVLSRTDVIGIQRAIGSVYFTQCHIERADKLWFVELEANAAEIRDIVGVYNRDLARELHDIDVRHSGVTDTVRNLSAIIINTVAESFCSDMSPAETLDLSLDWFGKMSLMIEFHQKLIRMGRDVIAGELTALVSSSEKEMITYSVVIVLITVVFSMAGMWYGLRIHRMTAEIQRFAKNITTKARELQKERHRTERLLYSMLPRAVAENLRAGRAVIPQYYDCVTIFFSDIVGFTSISAHCTPHQVVALLNSLYRLFDDIIEKYDVYKVETIADSYMVVSGLPERNGDAHVREIAALALEMMKEVKSHEVPDDPSIRIPLRVGIHSGSVVGAVIGTKTPRYCLFGDTVNVASRMETTSYARRIHLSTSSYEMLLKYDGFNMESRGVIRVKGKGDMRTYWLNSYVKLAAQVAQAQSGSTGFLLDNGMAISDVRTLLSTV